MNIGDKLESKVADMTKYVRGTVGAFQIIISVTKSCTTFCTKIVIIYLNKYQLCFYKKDLGKKVM